MKILFTVFLLISLPGFLSPCIGQSWPQHSIGENLWNPAMPDVADIDGDMDLDVAVTVFGANKVVWFENINLNWTKKTIDDNLIAPIGICIIDMDDDTDSDVVVGAWGEDKVVWYENGGGTPITWTQNIIDPSLDEAGVVSVADIDGDSDLDVAAQGKNVVVWYENTGGTPIIWSKDTIDVINGASSVRIADIDGDTDLDVAATGSLAGVVVWYENTGGTPITWSKDTIDANLPGAGVISVDDIDGDSDLDVAAQGNNVVVWYENTGGTPIIWSKDTIDANLPGAFALSVTDIDLDNNLDVVATGLSADDVVWYKNGGGTPITWEEFPIDLNFDGAKGICTADIDDDDTMDVVVTGKNTNNVVWYKNAFIVGIELLSGKVPTRHVLSQNYPNPFNPITVISWQLAVGSEVQLEVYNVMGQKVATLVNEKQPAGSYSIEFDASHLASGVYLYRLQAGDYIETRKMVLMR